MFYTFFYTVKIMTIKKIIVLKTKKYFTTQNIQMPNNLEIRIFARLSI